MDYMTLKTVHQTAVALSVTGFFVRGLLSLANSPLAGGRVAKTLPHVIDSLLLLSALMLVATLRINPAHTPWLMAKLIGLVFYIGLGVVALKPGLPAAVRALAWVAALATVGWMISVAITKSPFGFLAGLA